MPAKLGIYFDVTGCEIIGPYTLRLTFDDGSVQVIDFEPVLFGPIFEPLRDRKLFAQVKVNPDTGTIEWPNGADFSPVLLHDWPDYRDTLIADRRNRAGVPSSR